MNIGVSLCRLAGGLHPESVLTSITCYIVSFNFQGSAATIPLLSGGGSRGGGAVPSRGLLVEELSLRWGEGLMAVVGLTDIPCCTPPGLKLPRLGIPEPGLLPGGCACLLERLGGPDVYQIGM